MGHRKTVERAFNVFSVSMPIYPSEKLTQLIWIANSTWIKTSMSSWKKLLHSLLLEYEWVEVREQFSEVDSHLSRFGSWGICQRSSCLSTRTFTCWDTSPAACHFQSYEKLVTQAATLPLSILHAFTGQKYWSLICRHYIQYSAYE